MCQSGDQQASIQQILQGLSITYLRRETNRAQIMGKVGTRGTPEWKDVLAETPMDVRVHQRGD